MKNEPKITYMGAQIYPRKRDTVGRFTFKSKLREIRMTIVRWIQALLWAGFYAAIGGVALFGAYLGGQIVQARTVDYTAPITIVHSDNAPVLDRIAAAESHNSQFCTKALASNGWCHSYEIGQVLQHVNTNDTVDTGYYQINSIWGAKCAELGYNLTIESDNKACGKWLFQNFGSEPWSASKSKWNR